MSSDVGVFPVSRPCIRGVVEIDRGGVGGGSGSGGGGGRGGGGGGSGGGSGRGGGVFSLV